MVLEGISAAVSGLRVSEKRLSQSAHNLANLSTTGFSPGRLEQAELAQGGVQAAVRSSGQTGPVVYTGQALDLALDGGGFFVLDDGQGGRLYTRAGIFGLDSQGRLADGQGRPLSPEISIPAEAARVHISPQGLVQALDQDGRVIGEGQIQTASFGNPGGLEPVGGNAFRASEASGPPVSDAPGAAGHGLVVSGALQASGTDPAREMINLTASQRSFEANLAALVSLDEMVGSILDVTA
jgi:flagellar basal body rod protein FlgG